MVKNNQDESTTDLETVGIIPAAGRALRISPLPCSKELLPIGFGNTADDNLRPKVVSQYLLDKFRIAGVSKVYFILRKGKWDIPAYYGDGAASSLKFAYLMMNLPYGVPYTLDQAYPFVREAKVCMGFPDILFEPDNAYVIANQMLLDIEADLVVGLYPVKDKRQAQTCDMVQWDRSTGRIAEIVIKPQNTDLEYSWIFAVWTPAFTRFMHEYLRIERKHRRGNSTAGEIHLGHVVQQAIAEGLAVYGRAFSNDHFIDIGTPAALQEAYIKYRDLQILGGNQL